MINFTAGATNVLAACRAAKVETILTSCYSSKRAGSKPQRWAQKEVKIVYLDDIRATIGTATSCVASGNSNRRW